MASAPKYRCSPRAPRCRACTCHERLLPAHCGHKKASGNNEHKKATGNNYVPPSAADNARRHVPGGRPTACPRPRHRSRSRGASPGGADGNALTWPNAAAPGGRPGSWQLARPSGAYRIAPCQDSYRTSPFMARWGGVTPHPPRSATGTSRMQRAEHASAWAVRHGQRARAAGQHPPATACDGYQTPALDSHDHPDLRAEPVAGRIGRRNLLRSRRNGRRAAVRRGITHRESEKLSG